MKSWKKLTALLLAGVLAGSAFTGCGKQSNDSSKPESSAAEESSVKETEAAAETTEATTTTVHVSPTETVSSTLGTELTDINAMLDKGSDTANNYKAKLDNFEHDGDLYKVKTFHEITKLERNGMFVYESVPGTAVTELSVTDNGVSFSVEGPEDAQITLELEENAEYEIFIDGSNMGKMKTNLGGKLSLSVELGDAPVKVSVQKC